MLNCPQKKKSKKTVDTKPNFEEPEDIDSLREENAELKNELEREQLLHKMLYKEWKELNEQVPPKQYEVPDSKPQNLFYKYAFYVLLIALIPAVYFLYTGMDSEKKLSSSQAVTDSMVTSDSTPAIATGSVRGDIPKSDSQITSTDNQSINDDILHQPAIKPETNQSEIKPRENKAVSTDNGKQAIIPEHKTVKEGPLTDDQRDSIYWIGFNAYFDHHPNHFNKSSAKYKAWIGGWNDARAEGKKVLAKDSAQKPK
jgi:hypothetical protein